MMVLLSSWSRVLFMLFVSGTSANRLCPKTVIIERGTNFTIPCKIDENVDDFYWYKGQSGNKNLVGSLGVGAKSISENYKEQYDISSSGALLILQAEIIHESLYDLVKFYSNGSHDEETVIVNITISPDHPCPIINNCPPCDECELLQANRSGNLVCKVEGSRPNVALSWTSTSQSGVSLLKYPPKFQQRNGFTDSWDSSVSLHYEILDACKDQIVLKCNAEDDLNILKSRLTTITITFHTDLCNDGTKGGTLETKKSPATVIIILAAVAILFGVFVFPYVIFRKRRKRKKVQSVEQLVWSLKDRYRKFCYLKPLQWVEDIHIEEIYAESECTVEENGTISRKSTKELRTSSGIFAKRWVVLIAEHGHGRTTFLKKVLQEWIKDRDSTRVIVYIPLKDVTKSDKLSQIIVGDMPKAFHFTPADIEEMLKTKEFLVILDGLEDLQEGFMVGGIEECDEQDTWVESSVTIGQLVLGNANRTYTRLHVWVSTREADCGKLTNPTDKVEVKMAGFSKEQFLTYINMCCHYYYNLKSKKKTTGQIGATDECNNFCIRVEQFFSEWKITTNFKETPLLINLMLHILAANYTSAVHHLKNKRITDMTTLMRIVIDSMEARYIHKKTFTERKKFHKLEEKLGKFAFQQNGQLDDIKRSVWIKNIGKAYVKTALEIGLLKLSKTTSSAEEDPVIEFYHQQIGDYFANNVFLGSPV